MKVSCPAILTLIVLLIAPALTHYTTLSNSCSRLKVSGTIADAQWRGRTNPLGVGRTNTNGDTTVNLQTGFG